MKPAPCTEVFALIAELAAKDGVERIGDLPGTWKRSFGDWSFALNGHDDPVDSIPPYHAAIDHKGFPVGLVNMRDGTMLAGAEADFIAAIRAEIARVPE